MMLLEVLENYLLLSSKNTFVSGSAAVSGSAEDGYCCYSRAGKDVLQKESLQLFSRTGEIKQKGQKAKRKHFVH